ncbi:unnamed protein product [Linum trigynum]|uniref:Uncharacterized protein n=1 Tax=Linum trigynum TaxID=586398 RepID=A0AAV2E0D3_9ROSI
MGSRFTTLYEEDDNDQVSEQMPQEVHVFEAVRQQGNQGGTALKSQGKNKRSGHEGKDGNYKSAEMLARAKVVEMSVLEGRVVDKEQPARAFNPTPFAAETGSLISGLPAQSVRNIQDEAMVTTMLEVEQVLGAKLGVDTKAKPPDKGNDKSNGNIEGTRHLIGKTSVMQNEMEKGSLITKAPNHPV